MNRRVRLTARLGALRTLRHGHVLIGTNRGRSDTTLLITLRLKCDLSGWPSDRNRPQLRDVAIARLGASFNRVDLKRPEGRGRSRIVERNAEVCDIVKSKCSGKQ